MSVPSTSVLYCPRCDRRYESKPGDSYRKLMDQLIKHVSEQHPDYDPEWFDTFPSHV